MHIGLEMTTLRNSEVGGVWRYTESLVRALARRVGPHRYSLLFINAFNPWVRVPAPSVSWATLRNRSREECRDSTQGECRDSTRTISLRRDLAGDALRLTLLHEMCHIGQGDGSAHGPRFLRKLHRLVRLGESKL